MRRATTFSIVALLLYAVAIQVHATTITVINTNDSGPGSLRQALADANGGDTINFAVTGTIGLTSGELLVDKAITISGPGAENLAVNGNAKDRVFHVTGENVTISGLTITNGDASGNPLGGGGIYNDHSTLTINNCAISGNHTDKQGGGIYNDGSGSSATLMILNSTINGNFASSSHAIVAGGGIANDSSNAGSATLTIVDSLVDGNVADGVSSGESDGNGGGIYNNGAGATLAMTNSIVSNNRAGAQSGVSLSHGGGIWSSGAGTIMDSTVNGNEAGTGGGGIHNRGTLTITGSTINNNECGYLYGHYEYGVGGGIDNSAILTITSTTLSGNFVWYEGGGIYGSPIITNCSISGNQASHQGGGIFGSPTVTNSTISGNSGPDDGGGIYGGGIIRHSTIAGNTSSPSSGGIHVTSALEIGNTILKTGTSGPNIVNGGTVTSDGYNISNDNGAGHLTGPGDQINTDPMLGPLQNNGGPTLTHDLLAGSPALDAGNPNFTPPPSTDQRGYARVFNGRIDTGSLEVQPTPPPITISGTISYCSNPVPGPVPNVTLTLTGSSSGSTLSNGSGNYQFSSLPSGASYIVTPSKAPRLAGSAGIDTVDVVATQRHFLNLGTPLSGCRLTAADVNGDSAVNTIDVVAIQRFFLGSSTGIANVGKYQLNPVSRSYPGIVTDQTGQNYDTLVLGDVATPFVE